MSASSPSPTRSAAAHAAWLAQVREEPIDPERPTIDPHHHLWTDAEGRVPYLLADLWADIEDMARCPNVMAKLGGLAMPDNGYGWNQREQPPGSDELVQAQALWVHHVIECFGPERCMFESNFPVDRRSLPYGVYWNAMKKIAARYTPVQQQALFHDTAARVYRL